MLADDVESHVPVVAPVQHPVDHPPPPFARLPVHVVYRAGLPRKRARHLRHLRPEPVFVRRRLRSPRPRGHPAPLVIGEVHRPVVVRHRLQLVVRRVAVRHLPAEVFGEQPNVVVPYVVVRHGLVLHPLVGKHGHRPRNHQLERPVAVLRLAPHLNPAAVELHLHIVPLLPRGDAFIVRGQPPPLRPVEIMQRGTPLGAETDHEPFAARRVVTHNHIRIDRAGAAVAQPERVARFDVLVGRGHVGACVLRGVGFPQHCVRAPIEPRPPVVERILIRKIVLERHRFGDEVVACVIRVAVVGLNRTAGITSDRARQPVPPIIQVVPVRAVLVRRSRDVPDAVQ